MSAKRTRSKANLLSNDDSKKLPRLNEQHTPPLKSISNELNPINLNHTLNQHPHIQSQSQSHIQHQHQIQHPPHIPHHHQLPHQLPHHNPIQHQHQHQHQHPPQTQTPQQNVIYQPIHHQQISPMNQILPPLKIHPPQQTPQFHFMPSTIPQSSNMPYYSQPMYIPPINYQYAPIPGQQIPPPHQQGPLPPPPPSQGGYYYEQTSPTNPYKRDSLTSISSINNAPIHHSWKMGHTRHDSLTNQIGELNFHTNRSRSLPTQLDETLRQRISISSESDHQSQSSSSRPISSDHHHHHQHHHNFIEEEDDNSDVSDSSSIVSVNTQNKIKEKMTSESFVKRKDHMVKRFKELNNIFNNESSYGNDPHSNSPKKNNLELFELIINSLPRQNYIEYSTILNKRDNKACRYRWVSIIKKFQNKLEIGRLNFEIKKEFDKNLENFISNELLYLDEEGNESEHNESSGHSKPTDNEP